MIGRRLVATAAFAALAAGPAWAGRDKPAEVRAAIEGQNRRLAEAIALGDEDAAGAIYAEDAKLMPPNAKAIAGRRAIGEYWGSMRDAGIADATIETREVVLGKETATEIGVYRLRAADTRVIDEGKYIAVWQKVGRDWLNWRDLWNSDLKP